MKKFIPVFILVALSFFVIWMNITPGHFRHTCCYEIIYSNNTTMFYDGERDKVPPSTGGIDSLEVCSAVACYGSDWIDIFAKVLSAPDFYK